MDIRIQSLHFTAKPELLDFVNEKVDRLSHFNKDIHYADVCLRVEKSDSRDNKVCEIILGVPGNRFVAKKQCESFEEAIASSVKALEFQFGK